MDYQMSEIVKEIDRKKSLGGHKQSPSMINSNIPLENPNNTREGKAKMNKKDTMIMMTK